VGGHYGGLAVSVKKLQGGFMLYYKIKNLVWAGVALLILLGLVNHFFGGAK